MHDGTKPLYEPMLTSHQRGLLTFSWGQFKRNCLNITHGTVIWNKSFGKTSLKTIELMGCICIIYCSTSDVVPVYAMMTSSNGNIFRVTGPLCGEFTGHRWIPRTKAVTRSFDVFFDLRLNQQMSKQWRRRWSETPSRRSLWRHCYALSWPMLYQDFDISTHWGREKIAQYSADDTFKFIFLNERPHHWNLGMGK